ncbi:hypothetical protein [Hyphomicrobium sp. MC1]|uniref:hypothetical protein n=1 Tax=Hyphomicrobium sp. (strain MC1) TaxID=717785 RepID=UPI000213F798|nr:hypothetical protein [Hyphomicrobium sp. MC1]CCB63749.1 protein of unknown function [Hyphomicrobium sp. MC1]
MTKLSAEARERLRKEIRALPDIKSIVGSLSKINSLKKDELIALAEKCGLDVNAILVKSVNVDFANEHYTGKKKERMLHTNDHPAFKGELELDLTISLVGKSVTRKMKVEYSFTPSWEYFDLHKGSLYVGWESSVLKLSVQGLPEGTVEKTADGKMITTRSAPVWYSGELLFEDGVLTREMDDAIYAAVEQHCQEEDRRRRTEHRLPIPAYKSDFASE